jgi:hypothetical protein
MDYTGFEWVAFAVVLVLGVARLGRIATHDDYPPAEWVRLRWLTLVGDRWGKLAICNWCLNPYITAGSLAWWWFSDAHWSWWFFMGTFAAAQAASTFTAYDEP